MQVDRLLLMKSKQFELVGFVESINKTDIPILLQTPLIFSKQSDPMRRPQVR